MAITLPWMQQQSKVLFLMTEMMQNMSQAAFKLFWKMGEKTQIALVAAACLNKKQMAGSVPLSVYSSISASSPQALVVPAKTHQR